MKIRYSKLRQLIEDEERTQDIRPGAQGSWEDAERQSVVYKELKSGTPYVRVFSKDTGYFYDFVLKGNRVVAVEKAMKPTGTVLKPNDVEELKTLEKRWDLDRGLKTSHVHLPQEK